MAARRTTFGKMQRDRDKKAKAAAKQERRRERLEAAGTDDEAPPAPAAEVSQAEVIDQLEALHARFDDGEVDFEEFEEQKAALLARLSVG